MEQVWELILNNYLGFLIVFARVSGIFTFNPIFSRTNTPMQIRVAMALTMSAMMFSYMGGTVGYTPVSLGGFVGIIIKEFFLGFVFGTMVNLILTVLIYAGEIVDNQIGLGMAKAMDPSTGVQMPVFANMFYYIFIIYFFVVGGHLDYIRLFWLSFELVPIGFTLTDATRQIAAILVDYLGTVFELGVKLAMPVVAAELIVEFCIGIMMKAVPTIQVTAVNIQLKVFIGLLILMAITSPIANFLEYLFDLMRTNLYALAEGFV